jgi:hypothetical protein
VPVRFRAARHAAPLHWQAPVLPDSVAIALVCLGIPASLGRLWVIWWRSLCAACGYEHRACECPPQGPMMRPRR